MEVLELDHYLETLVVKPGALEGSSALQRARDEGRFTPLHEKFWRVARRRLGDKDGTKALIECCCSNAGCRAAWCTKPSPHCSRSDRSTRRSSP